MENVVEHQSLWKRLSVIDWLYAALLCTGSLYAFSAYGRHMDVYEEAILLLAGPTFAYLGWQWKPMRWLMPLLAVLSLFAISQYAGQLDFASKKFFLKYLLSSQSAILWMSTFFFLSTLFYWGGLIARSDFGASVGSGLCWAAVVIGSTGTSPWGPLRPVGTLTMASQISMPLVTFPKTAYPHPSKLGKSRLLLSFTLIKNWEVAL